MEFNQFAVTVACCVIPVPLIVADTFRVPTPLGTRYPMKTPEPSVVPDGGFNASPPLSELITTLAPLIGLPN